MMFKIPSDKNITITINDQSIAPVIAASLPPPFAYVTFNTNELEHARDIFENCGLNLGKDVTVTSKDTLSEKVPVPPDPIIFHIGQKISVKTVIQTIADFGYTRVPRIENEEEFSVRGDIIDIFAPIPIRIMFLGDKIESIRAIDANSFKTQKELESCTIPPIHEKCTIKDWQTVLDTLIKKVPIIVLEEQTRLKIWQCRQGDFESTKAMTFKTEPVANFFSALSVLVPEILWNVKTRGKTVLIYVGSSRACEKYLDTKGINYFVTHSDDIKSGEINVIRQNLGVSFELVDYNLVVYSLGNPSGVIAAKEAMDAGSNATMRTYGRKSLIQRNSHDQVVVNDETSVDLSSLLPGKLVIHEKHGLGRYLGTKKMDLGDKTREYLVLQYDGGTFVYLPIDQANQLYDYYGSPRRLDRI